MQQVPNHLPEKHYFAHNLCLELHDQISRIIVFGEKENIFHFSFEFESREKVDFWEKGTKGRTGLDLWEWLDQNGYPNVNKEVTKRQIFVALLSDFSQFIINALHTSVKGQLSVTYSLLRKPLKDNLLLLEWLVGDAEGLLEIFLNKKISRLAIEKFTPEQKMEIIEGALNKYPQNELITAKFLYELRYKKSPNSGFEYLWNKAAHIITNVDAYATEDQNLNFVFSDWDSKLSQWEFLYSFLPIILFHTIEIADSFLPEISAFSREEEALARFKRILHFVAWSREIDPSHDQKEFSHLLEEISSTIKITCSRCNNHIVLIPKEAISFLQTGNIRCNNCFRLHKSDPYESIKALPIAPLH